MQIGNKHTHSHKQIQGNVYRNNRKKKNFTSDKHTHTHIDKNKVSARKQQGKKILPILLALPNHIYTQQKYNRIYTIYTKRKRIEYRQYGP